MFKVNNENTRTTFYCIYCSMNIFHTFLKCFFCWLGTSKCFLGPTLSIYKYWNNILLQLLTDVLEEHLQPWIEYMQCIGQISILGVLLLQRSTSSHIFEWYRYYLRDHLQWSSFLKGTAFLWNKQSSLFWKILSLFAISVAAIRSMNGHFSIVKEQLLPRILSNLLCFYNKRNYSREI